MSSRVPPPSLSSPASPTATPVVGGRKGEVVTLAAGRRVEWKEWTRSTMRRADGGHATTWTGSTSSSRISRAVALLLPCRLRAEGCRAERCRAEKGLLRSRPDGAAAGVGHCSMVERGSESSAVRRDSRPDDARHSGVAASRCSDESGSESAVWRLARVADEPSAGCCADDVVGSVGGAAAPAAAAAAAVSAVSPGARDERAGGASACSDGGTRVPTTACSTGRVSGSRTHVSSTVSVVRRSVRVCVDGCGSCTGLGSRSRTYTSRSVGRIHELSRTARMTGGNSSESLPPSPPPLRCDARGGLPRRARSLLRDLRGGDRRCESWRRRLPSSRARRPSSVPSSSSSSSPSSSSQLWLSELSLDPEWRAP